MNPNFKKFNINNFTKLFFPLNSKKFNELIIPIQKYLEDILTEIDYKSFKNDFTEYKKIFNSLNTKV